MNKIDETSLKTEKKIWKKPRVLTYGDAVEIIRAEKDFNLDDGNTLGGDSIGSA
jgi:hypothetical protein